MEIAIVLLIFIVGMGWLPCLDMLGVRWAEELLDRMEESLLVLMFCVLANTLFWVFVGCVYIHFFVEPAPTWTVIIMTG